MLRVDSTRCDLRRAVRDHLDVDGNYRPGPSDIVGIEHNRAVQRTRPDHCQVECDVKIHALAGLKFAFGRRNRHPADRLDLDCKVVVHVTVCVVEHLQSVSTCGIFDADSAVLRVGGTGKLHVEILVHNSAIRIQDGLERVLAVAVVPRQFGPFYYEAVVDCVIVVEDAAVSRCLGRVEVVPIDGHHVVWLSGIGDRDVGVCIPLCAKCQITVGADPNRCLDVSVEWEAEREIDHPGVIAGDRQLCADSADLNPVECRTARFI